MVIVLTNDEWCLSALASKLSLCKVQARQDSSRSPFVNMQLQRVESPLRAACFARPKNGAMEPWSHGGTQQHGKQMRQDRMCSSSVDKDLKNYDKVLYRVVLTDDKLSSHAGIASAFPVPL